MTSCGASDEAPDVAFCRDEDFCSFVSATDGEDAWARAFAARSPIIHIKQSSTNKGGHWPFTAAHNRDGRIWPEKLIATVREGGGGDNELCMEFAFREREPADRDVVRAIRESVAFWKPHADVGLRG